MSEPRPAAGVLERPSALLAAARAVLDRPEALPGSAWARAIALLTRQALEGAVAAYWLRTAPGTEQAPFTSQALCLRSYAGPAIAAEVFQCWAALSDACHHHVYDLAPTASELRRWLDATAHVVDQLACTDRGTSSAAASVGGSGDDGT